MKLIYLSHWRFPSGKTTTPFTLRSCEEFAKLGYEVELWIPRRKNPDDHGEDLFKLYNIQTRLTVKKLGAIDWMDRLGAAGFVLMVASFGYSALRELKKEKNKDTLVYAQDLRDAILPARAGLPFFVEIHDFYESSWKFLNRAALRRVSGLVVTNRIKMERLYAAYQFSKERMLWQPNAVDAGLFDSPKTKIEARQELDLPLDTSIALYTGHLYSWKGVDTLVRAAKFLPERMLVYIVGGTDKDRARLEELAKKEQAFNAVFVAHQPHSRVPLYLRAADVLVLPNTAKEDASKYETSPVKLFEYLASGTPVVASDLPSVREIVSEKEVCFAKADDAENFANAIQQVVQNKDASAERTLAGRAFAQAHSWEARAKYIDAFIKKHG